VVKNRILKITNMNKTLRYIIRGLFSLMREKTRDDIYHKYEVMGDCGKVLKLRATATLKDISMQY
jgi:hypothetical protein